MWNYTPRFAKSTAHICLEMWWIHMERVAEHQAVWCGMWSCCFLPLILSMETGWMFFQQSHIETCTLLESVWGILLRFQVLEGTYLSTRQDFFQHHFYHVVGYKCGGFCVIIANSHDITKVIEDSLMKWNMTYVYGCVSIWGSLRSQLHSKVSNHKKKTTTTTRTTTKKRKKNQHKNRNKETRTPQKISPFAMDFHLKGPFMARCASKFGWDLRCCEDLRGQGQGGVGSEMKSEQGSFKDPRSIEKQIRFQRVAMVDHVKVHSDSRHVQPRGWTTYIWGRF